MDNPGGVRLNATLWTLTTIAGILLGIRVYCKIWRTKGLWWDDHFLIFSWVTLLIAVSINTYIISLGFGRHMETISDENLRAINLNTIIVACFGIIATTTGKTSFAIMLYRISTNQWMKWALIFIIITINLTMNLVWIFGFAKCTPLAKVFDNSVPGTCWDKNKLGQFQLFASYYSAILDFVLAFMPWPILMNLVMKRREKLGVAIAMSLGAIAGICGIVKSVMVVNMTSPDITHDRVDLTIWTLTEPAVSIMAISIPVLRMLYHEIKSSSQRSHYRDRASRLTSNEPNTDRKSKMFDFGIGSKAGQTQVSVMSTPGWQESQEALKDDEDVSSTERYPAPSGIMKTEEYRVRMERMSSQPTDDAVELGSLSYDRRKQ